MSGSTGSLNNVRGGKLYRTGSTKGDLMRKLAIDAFSHLPYVGEYRQIGLVGAIELVADPLSKEPLPGEERIGYQIYQRALAKGLLIRPLGNILYFMPPYVISEEEMRFMIETTRQTIETFLQNGRKRYAAAINNTLSCNDGNVCCFDSNRRLY